MTASSFFDRIERINVFKKGNLRAPHKPLYLLLCLSALQKGLPRLMPYSEIEITLSEAINRFGPSASTVSPQYPFWRLQSDELAEVSPAGPYVLRSKDKEPTKTSLLEQDAHGGLLVEDYQMLQNNLELQTLAIHKILDAHFPRSIHEDILDFFGLRLSGLRGSDLNTESEFKEKVLNAYGRTCAFTGYSLSYRGSCPGLEAAHICWPQAGGNDTISNGIAMTTLFRKLFHLGLVTIDETLAIRFSVTLRNSGSSASSVLDLEGGMIKTPSSQRDYPDLGSLAWHRKWVFRS
jgi:putative restriction endonuclease